MKTCPFCKAKEVDVRRVCAGHWYSYISCRYCGAQGPCVQESIQCPPLEAEAEAIGRWNTRP